MSLGKTFIRVLPIRRWRKPAGIEITSLCHCHPMYNIVLRAFSGILYATGIAPNLGDVAVAVSETVQGEDFSLQVSNDRNNMSPLIRHPTHM